MGSILSGRQYWSKSKLTTENIPKMDIRKFKKMGFLNEGEQLEWSWINRNNHKKMASLEIIVLENILLVTSLYKFDNFQINEDPIQVELDYTDCFLGGSRPWFVCPLCGRRCAILYLCSTPACRICHDLSYECQRETDYGRYVRKVNKIRKSVGWTKGAFDEEGVKPLWMHWSTYHSIRLNHVELQSNALNLLDSRINKIVQSIPAFTNKI